MNSIHTRVLVRLVTVAVFSADVEAATAETFSFFNVTNNNAGDAAIGEAQLFVDVTDAGPGQVLFTFYNIGPEDGSITDVFFDDGALLGVAEIGDGHPGVSFPIQATPSLARSPRRQQRRSSVRDGVGVLGRLRLLR